MPVPTPQSCNIQILAAIINLKRSHKVLTGEYSKLHENTLEDGGCTVQLHRMFWGGGSRRISFIISRHQIEVFAKTDGDIISQCQSPKYISIARSVSLVRFPGIMW